jgi:hypothetical protein
MVADSPEDHAYRSYSHDLTQSFALGAEAGMSQETSDEDSHFILVRLHYGKAITRMTEAFLEKPHVARYESRASKFAELNDNLFVLQPLRQKVVTYLSHPNSGSLKQLPLSIEDVFVENDQARMRSKKYSEAAYWPA